MTAFSIVQDGRVFFTDIEIAQMPPNLAALIEQFQRRIEPEPSYSSRVTRLLNDLKRVAGECIDVASTHIFGSSVNGFRTANSDVDVLFVLRENGSDPQLRTLVNHLRSGQEAFSIKAVITRASVPIVTVYHRVTGLCCDISFSVPALPRKAVINNTNLLKTYAKTYPEVPIAFKFLKSLFGLTKFSSARTNGLSTYGHIILYLYYLTHHLDYPLIHTVTYEPTAGTPPDLSPDEIVLSYLRFLACELDSSQVVADIRIPEMRPRYSNGKGRVVVCDPYVKKNLGQFMGEKNLFAFKVFCYRLLEVLARRDNISDDWLEEWCSEQLWDTTPPILHPACVPVYAAESEPKPSRRTKPAPPTTLNPAPRPLGVKECCSVTMAPGGAGGIQVSSTRNQRLCDHTITRDIPLDVFGDKSGWIESLLSDPKLLPCLGVFFSESLVEEAEVILNRIALPGLRVSSCFTGHSNPNIHLTNYYGLMQSGNSSRCLCVYNPSMNLPIALWKLIFHNDKPLYFLLPDKLDEATLELLAQRYTAYSAVTTEHVTTLPLGKLRERVGGESLLPEQILVYRVSVKR